MDMSKEHTKEMTETKSEAPPSYAGSDVDSLHKPDIEQAQPKALPKWQNNVFLRSARRRYISIGSIITLVILIAVLAGVGATQQWGKSKTKAVSQYVDPQCVAWVFATPSDNREPDAIYIEGVDLKCLFAVNSSSPTHTPPAGGRKMKCFGVVRQASETPGAVFETCADVLFV